MWLKILEIILIYTTKMEQSVSFLSTMGKKWAQAVINEIRYGRIMTLSSLNSLKTTVSNSCHHWPYKEWQITMCVTISIYTKQMVLICNQFNYKFQNSCLNHLLLENFYVYSHMLWGSYKRSLEVITAYDMLLSEELCCKEPRLHNA